MKRLISAVSVAILLVGAWAAPVSAAAPRVVATINGGGTSTMAAVFGISNPGTSVFGFTVKLLADGSATGHIDCVDQHGDAPGFPGNIFGEVVRWSGDLNGEVTLYVVGKFLPIPGGHPSYAEFAVRFRPSAAPEWATGRSRSLTGRAVPWSSASRRWTAGRLSSARCNDRVGATAKRTCTVRAPSPPIVTRHVAAIVLVL